MLPHDPLIFAEEWSLDAAGRRPWRPGNDAVFCEYQLATAIWEDLMAAEEEAEERRARWLGPLFTAFDVGIRALMGFFAFVGLFVLLGEPLPGAVPLAGLLAAGGAIFAIWREINDARWSEEVRRLAVLKSCDVARFQGEV